MDMDDVIVDLVGGFSKEWRKRYPNYPFVAPEEYKEFYIRDNYPKNLTPLIDEVYYSPGFYSLLLPIPGSIEGVKRIVQAGYKVFICTNFMSNNERSKEEKRLWVMRFLGRELAEKIIFAKDKTIVRGDLLIDDKPVIEGRNPNPSWKHIIFDQPYNRGVKGTRINWNNYRKVIEI